MQGVDLYRPVEKEQTYELEQAGPGKSPWQGRMKLASVTLLLFSILVVTQAQGQGNGPASPPVVPVRETQKQGQSSVEKASALQPAVAGPTTGQDWQVAALGLDMVYVGPGTFQMGSDKGAEDEQPIHTVKLSQGYWIGKYELTQQQYTSVMGENPSSFPGDNHPVESVTWHDCMSFCRRLTEQEKQAGRLPAGYAYRLPTEAEWEYAARGGDRETATEFAGSDNIDEVAWHKGNSERKTHPIGQKQANELGLHDLSGNVYEWCLDWKAAYTSALHTDPQGAEMGSHRVRRGGAWYGFASSCRVTSRFFHAPTAGGSLVGLRVVLGPEIREPESGGIVPIDKVTAQASSSHGSNMGPEKTIGGVGLNTQDQHSTVATDMWLSGMGSASPWIQYEFDRVYRLHEMWVWNSNQLVESFIGLGAKGVTIKTSIDGLEWAPLTPVPQFAQAPGKPDYTANTKVPFNGAMGKYVRIYINSGWGMMPQYGLSEVRFFCTTLKSESREEKE